MNRISKNYFRIFRGKKVTLEIVPRGGDIKVQFVDHFGDYKIKVSNNDFNSCDTIKVEVVDHFPDVKLEKTSFFEDFEVCIK